MRFQNEFGVVEITRVSETVPIEKITSDHPAVNDNRIDLETAEKVALITENRNIQVGMPLHARPYVVLHDGPSQAAIRQVEVEAWHSETSAQQALEDAHPNTYAGPVPVSS